MKRWTLSVGALVFIAACEGQDPGALPAIDKSPPAKLETATFALG